MEFKTSSPEFRKSASTTTCSTGGDSTLSAFSLSVLPIEDDDSLKTPEFVAELIPRARKLWLRQSTLVVAAIRDGRFWAPKRAEDDDCSIRELSRDNCGSASADCAELGSPSVVSEVEAAEVEPSSWPDAFLFSTDDPALTRKTYKQKQVNGCCASSKKLSVHRIHRKKNIKKFVSLSEFFVIFLINKLKQTATYKLMTTNILYKNLK